MYRRKFDGWLKHYDFVLLDLLCLQAAFVLSYMIRLGPANPYADSVYGGMAIFIVFADIAVIVSTGSFKNVIKRGYLKELTAVVKQMVFIELLAAIYLFTLQIGANYSRMTLYLMGGVYVVLTYIVRICWKSSLKKRLLRDGKRSLLLITTNANAAENIERIKTESYEGFRIAGLVITDKKLQGQAMDGIPVVANVDNVTDFICHEWIDEVLIVPQRNEEFPHGLMDKLLETGVTVHLGLDQMAKPLAHKSFIEKIGTYTVLTTSLNYASSGELIAKRMLDIAGGLFGCILTGILFLFIAPAIYISSPGPIFFAQTRVGKNGKKFKMYKFRSMYMDAEERKKDMMKENRIKDGMMFKVEFDTRVIGNKILPSGEKKTGIGNFIRTTSLDEFPQFFNVLKGDMSLVGTRPPTVDEWEKYQLHHRARLAIKPGITGMWQASGRSEITDFEEVVRLDTKYIREWSLGLDFKILWKTVWVVLRKEGSM